MTPAHKPHFEYDPQGNLCYIRFSDWELGATKRVYSHAGHTVILDLSNSGKVLGIELIGIATRPDLPQSV